MAALIQLQKASKIYYPGENEVRALDDVTLTIGEGEFVAIIGQSGSGKSTLMNLLGCLDVVSCGSYLIDGTDVAQLDDDKISDIRNTRIGFIFQGFNLIPTLTALENVELPLRYRGLHREQRRRLALEALERVNLSQRASHRPAELSGGQQQRVAIARAIAARPPIILADEPTGNLDRTSGAQVMEILTGLWQEGKTVVLITHDPQIAQSARRVVTISDGKVIHDYINESIN